MGKSKAELADTLASIAFFVLDARGLTDNPTRADIASAVVRSGDLLELCGEADAPAIYTAAIDGLVARHKYALGSDVMFTPPGHTNGYDHKTGETIPARPGDKASR